MIACPIIIIKVIKWYVQQTSETVHRKASTEYQIRVFIKNENLSKEDVQRY